jgi:hypothetical protein
VLGVVRQQPIGLARYRRKKYGYICGVPDQVATGLHESLFGIRDNVRISQFQQPAIMLNELVGIQSL